MKVRLDIPQNSLPTGITNARIQIAPVANRGLPAGIHVDTAFSITAVSPPELGTLIGGDQDPLVLTIRYDPVACNITPAVESTLVLGRLSPAGLWQEVCGDLANTAGALVREVSCFQGDISFGTFGVIQRSGNPFDDRTPPTFPARAFNLSLEDSCRAACDPAPWIELSWGPATDEGGSGIKAYRIYADGLMVAVTTNITANPTVRYRLGNFGTFDTTRFHTYQITAVDNADNESARFGLLTAP
ncbi:MAG: hypothetical protein ACOYXR_11140 [Nitrospirota bacterium]